MNKALDELKAENAGWEVIGMAPDLTDYAAVKAAVDDVAHHFGKVDILVNNAGISAREPLEAYEPESFKRIMDLNVTALFNGCKAVEPIMKAQGGGCIINTSSMVSLYGQPSGVGYPTSKFAVNGMTKSLARELGASASASMRLHPASPAPPWSQHCRRRWSSAFPRPFRSVVSASRRKWQMCSCSSQVTLQAMSPVP